MTIKKRINEYLNKNIDEIIAIRGHLHENPELSEKEYDTAKFIRGQLEYMDIEYIDVKGNSIIGLIDSGKPGKTLLMRADMDALAIEENPCNFKEDKAFVSQNEGISHMCGHDAHMAILLGTLKFLYSIKNDLHGRIVFVFEEAEENGRGIPKVLRALEDVEIDACYGLHVVNFIEAGRISMDPGPRMAGVSAINIDIIGHGGHGSRPDLAINPLFCGADIISTVSSLWANKLAPDEVCTLGLTNLIGGQAANIIEEKMTLVGTLRFFNKVAGEKGLKIVTETAQEIGKIHGCEIKINHQMYASNPLNNDEDLSSFAKHKLRSHLGDRLVKSDPWYASESFGSYGKLAPYLFAFLGNRNEDKGITAENHDPRFDIDDENTLRTGVEASSFFAYYYLNDF